MPLEEVDDDLLMRGTKHQLAVAPVLELEEDIAHGGAPARLLPQLGGMQRRKMDLLPTGAVHLLADDLFNLA